MPEKLLTILFLAISQFSSDAQAQLIVAHRGASHDAPENTLAAFRLAWEKHADGIEGDFYLTKDAQIVCIHDRTTAKTAPDQPELTVADSTFDELRTLDVGKWKHPRYAGERIPLLTEVLAIVPDEKVIFVEIKCGPEILPVMKPQLENSGLMPAQIVIICFDKVVVAQARQLMPQYKINWLTGYKQQTKQSPWKPNQREVVESLRQTNATGFGTQNNLNVINQEFVSAVRNAGVEFHVWTVNDSKQARLFKSLGVESITTDRPAYIRNALQ